MQTTTKTITHSKTESTEMKANRPGYRIEYQPQLVEETVLRAIVAHPEEGLFRKERNAIYEMQDDEAREEAFQELHQRWLQRLGLNTPLYEVLALWPILQCSTHKCLLLSARSKKDISADLFVTSKESGISEEAQRTIIIQLTAELLSQSQQWLAFLRHELLHIVDMLDPQFGYQPDFPESHLGPTYDHILQERYRILWDMTIDGRLCQRGWLPSSVKEKYWTIFKNTFSGPTKELEIVFSFFIDNGTHTHQELVSFAQSTENWFVRSSEESVSKGQCSLCSFPSFQLIYPTGQLSTTLINRIRKEHPKWRPTQPICRQCADLYEWRIHQPQ